MIIKKGSPLPQGCKITGNTVNFSVAAPNGEDCELILYKKGCTSPYKMIKMNRDLISDRIQYCAIELEKGENFEYNYRIGKAIITDPYGKDFTGRENWGVGKNIEDHEVRTKIVYDSFEWNGDRPLRHKMNEVIAYSIHVRGFTRHHSSQVKAKGTFAGIKEKIPYLKELGINQLQCMPVYDFEENLKYLNFWGYGEANCFAPKASYAESEAVREFQDLVLSLHQAGIEIIIEMPFNNSVSQGFMLECLRFWSRYYHVDGFIINPSVCNLDMLVKDEQLSGVKILYKHDEFQNTMRRFLKGDEGMISPVIYWMKKDSGHENIYNYITSPNGFTLYDLVSYDEKHNEENGENNTDGPDYNYSWNCGVEGNTRKKSVLELRRRQIKNAFFLLLLSQGTPCILGGDEFYNSQRGNNNVYCQDNPVSWLEWKKAAQEDELFIFVKELIRFRKEHAILYSLEENKTEVSKTGIPVISYHGEEAWKVQDHIASRQLGVFYHDDKHKEGNIYITYNMHWTSHIYALPKLPKGQKWYLAGSTEEGMLEKLRALEEIKEIEIKARTICVFIGK